MQRWFTIVFCAGACTTMMSFLPDERFVSSSLVAIFCAMIAGFQGFWTDGILSTTFFIVTMNVIHIFKMGLTASLFKMAAVSAPYFLLLGAIGGILGSRLWRWLKSRKDPQTGSNRVQ